MDVDVDEVNPRSLGIHTQSSSVKIHSPTEDILRRKIKTLNQKIRRRNVKISSMAELIKRMKESGHNNENLNSVMENYFTGFPLELLVHQHNNEGVVPKRRRYSNIMKQFAQTLYFYSPKAYTFVRQHFILPNGRTIRNWLSTFNCKPGFLLEVLEFLKVECKSKQYLKDCALIFDSMSIRKQICWDEKEDKHSGYSDYGGIIDCDLEDPASEVLMFQIVSYQNNFKCPVAYFLTNRVHANV
jgi:DNA transposase THAP9